MRALILLTTVIAITTIAPLRVVAQPAPNPEHPVMSVFSPFAGMVDQMIQSRPSSPLPFICPVFQYYKEAGSLIIRQENLPTSKWAFRVTLPSANAVPPCTVWNVHVDFELIGAAASRDTIQFFLREVAAPHTQIFTTFYLARLGENFGSFELDPPPPTLPPTIGRPIIGFPRRDMYVGYYVRGDAANAVKWRFRAPSQFTNPVRSVAFTSNTTWATASSIVGQSVDWVASARVCCNYFPPVELSLFSGVVENGNVRLSWKTESETNNYQFEVLRSHSPDGPWESRGFIAGRGTTHSPQWYEFRDQLPSPAAGSADPPILFYRLSQMDFDGSTNDSPVIRVLLASPETLSVRMHPAFPNPLHLNSGAPAVLRYELDREMPTRMSVIDPLGRELSVLTDEIKPAGVHESIWNPAAVPGLSTGTYYFRLVAGDVISTTRLGLVR